MGGRDHVEWVAGMAWNEWPDGVEYSPVVSFDNHFFLHIPVQNRKLPLLYYSAYI